MPPFLIPRRGFPANLVSIPLPRRASPEDLASILPRQDSEPSVVIPAHYGGLSNAPEPGTVAGIVLGSVAGFLLILWLIYTCVNFGQPVDSSSSYTAGASAMSRRSRSRHHKHSSPRARVIATEEIRTRQSGGGPVIIDAEPVVMQERRSSRTAPRVVVDDDDDEEVVVIEEHSPPRRRGGSGRRSSERHSRRESGYYREVDPDRYAGGDAPPRDMSRRGSRRRS